MPIASRTKKDQWLTLVEACQRLGVHPSTLRRWVDQGAIGALRTPGGHRRFSVADVDRFELEHRRGALPVAAAAPVEQTIARTRQGLHSQRWLASFDETERELHRQIGRRLVGLLLQYAARTDTAPELLAEARAIGRQHASSGLAHGRALPEMLEAICYFRRTLLELAVVQSHGRSPAQRQAGVRLLHRVEELLDEVQAGLVAHWLDNSLNVYPAVREGLTCG